MFRWYTWSRKSAGFYKQKVSHDVNKHSEYLPLFPSHHRQSPISISIIPFVTRIGQTQKNDQVLSGCGKGWNGPMLSHFLMISCLCLAREHSETREPDNSPGKVGPNRCHMGGFGRNSERERERESRKVAGRIIMLWVANENARLILFQLPSDYELVNF